MKMAGSFVTLFFIWSSTLVLTSGFPADQATLKELRSKIITKHDFPGLHNTNREKKSGNAFQPPKLPEPFVISTSLNVRDNSNSDGRRGRTWKDPSDGAIVVEGVRMPDDESDRITWRNGRVINNVFVPNEPEQRSPKAIPQVDRRGKSVHSSVNFDDDALDETEVDYKFEDEDFGEITEEASGRDYKYHAGSTETGRPVYYIVEEPDSLHSDRSPYLYEPADTHTSISSQVSDYTSSGLGPQNPSDFVIKHQTYSMCPGCPSFSIPVPVPKSSYTHDQHHQYNRQPSAFPSRPDLSQILQNPGAQNLTFFDHMKLTMENLQNRALELFSFSGDKSKAQSNSLSEKIDSDVSASSHQTSSKLSEKQSSSSGPSPLALAGIAAAALGGMALVSSAVTLSKFQGGAISTSRTFPKLDDDDDIFQRIVKKNFEMFQEYSWDSDCIFDQLCGDVSKGEDSFIDRILLKTCAKRKKADPATLKRCEKKRNEYRIKHNHRIHQDGTIH